MVSAAEPQTFFLPRQQLGRLVERLHVGGRQVIGPTIRDGAVMLDEIETADQLPVGWGVDVAPGKARLIKRDDERVFDQPPGPTSWKRWTYPPRLTAYAWSDPVAEETRSPKPVPAQVTPAAFLGVRACEIAALRVQDRVLLEGPVVDRDYAARRRGNLIVAVECAVAGGTCFCTSMGTGPEVREGFDLALSEIDDGFVVRVGTDAGRAALDGLALAPASGDQTTLAAAQVAAVREKLGQQLPMEGLPDRLMAAAESPRWAQIAERCLACTNCTLVCPTCFCTSVSQRSDLDGAAASAERSWDSCFTLDFARVAGGNFRTRVADRYRQWLTHKFGTWWPQFGSSGCVGCGRCIAWCPVGIDVREELLAVAPVAELPIAEVPIGAMPTAAPPVIQPLPAPAGPQGVPAEPGRPMPWRTVEVLDRQRETHDVVTLMLGTDDPGLLAGRPGQFVMAGLPAVAVPPISVSRFHPDGLELTIRAAGPATAALVNLERGDKLALRGPLGRGWPVELTEGRDVMVITGGIGLAPLRPLLDHMLARRDRIAQIHLAYGARTPGDRLYVDELDRLAASGVIDIAQTVDRAGPEWLGRVGVVTQVIDRVLCACDRTVAFVCGPERMMRATVDVLHERGIADERIWVTLERHMDCGVGLCGHCQLGRFFVCKDGPVFSLAELGPAFMVEGL